MINRLFRVSGYSMYPTLEDGEIVKIIDSDYKDNDIIIADTGAKLIVKRVKGQLLVGDNKFNTAIYPISTVKILGKVMVDLQSCNDTDLSKVYAETKTVKFSSSMSRTRSQTITIPNLQSIDNISVDTGNVSHTVNGDQVTITVSNGTATSSLYNPTKYSKSASGYKTSSSNSFSSIYSYSDESEYSGTLSKNGSSYVISGEYTPGDTMIVSDSRTSSSNSFNASISYNSGGYSGTLSKSGSAYVISGSDADSKSIKASGILYYTYYSKWDGDSWHGDGWTRTYSPKSYSDGVYSGSYTSWTFGSLLTHTDEPLPSNPYIGQRAVRARETASCTLTGTASKPDTRVWQQNYSGTVTKPASDTRVWRQNYSGTVYKGGTDYYYCYNVTLEYTDNRTPSILLTKLDDNQILSEGTTILFNSSNEFAFKINVQDSDLSDSLQYQVRLRGAIKTDWSSIANGEDKIHTISLSELLLGNNDIQVLAKDDKGEQVIRNFTVRNKTPDSISLRDVKDVIIALGYLNSNYRQLNDLKPSGYSSSTISLSEIIDFLA